MPDSNDLREFNEILKSTLAAPPKNKACRKHSVEKVLTGISMRNMNMPYSKIASELGVGETTVKDWVNRRTVTSREIELSDEFNKNLKTHLLSQAQNVLSSVDDDVIQKASLQQRGIYTDIMLRNAREVVDDTGSQDRVMERVLDTRARRVDAISDKESVTLDIEALKL